MQKEQAEVLYDLSKEFEILKEPCLFYQNAQIDSSNRIYVCLQEKIYVLSMRRIALNKCVLTDMIDCTRLVTANKRIQNHFMDATTKAYCEGSSKEQQQALASFILQDDSLNIMKDTMLRGRLVTVNNDLLSLKIKLFRISKSPLLPLHHPILTILLSNGDAYNIACTKSHEQQIMTYSIIENLNEIISGTFQANLEIMSFEWSEQFIGENQNKIYQILAVHASNSFIYFFKFDGVSPKAQLLGRINTESSKSKQISLVNYGNTGSKRNMKVFLLTGKFIEVKHIEFSPTMINLLDSLRFDYTFVDRIFTVPSRNSNFFIHSQNNNTSNLNSNASNVKSADSNENEKNKGNINNSQRKTHQPSSVYLARNEEIIEVDYFTGKELSIQHTGEQLSKVLAYYIEDVDSYFDVKNRPKNNNNIPTLSNSQLNNNDNHMEIEKNDMNPFNNNHNSNNVANDVRIIFNERSEININVLGELEKQSEDPNEPILIETPTYPTQNRSVFDFSGSMFAPYSIIESTNASLFAVVGAHSFTSQTISNVLLINKPAQRSTSSTSNSVVARSVLRQERSIYLSESSCYATLHFNWDDLLFYILKNASEFVEILKTSILIHDKSKAIKKFGLSAIDVEHFDRFIARLDVPLEKIQFINEKLLLFLTSLQRESFQDFIAQQKATILKRNFYNAIRILTKHHPNAMILTRISTESHFAESVAAATAAASIPKSKVKKVLNSHFEADEFSRILPGNDKNFEEAVCIITGISITEEPMLKCKNCKHFMIDLTKYLKRDPTNSTINIPVCFNLRNGICPLCSCSVIPVLP